MGEWKQKWKLLQVFSFRIQDVLVPKAEWERDYYRCYHRSEMLHDLNLEVAKRPLSRGVHTGEIGIDGSG